MKVEFNFNLTEKQTAQVISALREVSNNYSELAEELLQRAIEQKKEMTPELAAPVVEAEVVEETETTNESNG